MKTGIYINRNLKFHWKIPIICWFINKNTQTGIAYYTVASLYTATVYTATVQHFEANIGCWSKVADDVGPDGHQRLLSRCWPSECCCPAGMLVTARSRPAASAAGASWPANETRGATSGWTERRSPSLGASPTASTASSVARQGEGGARQSALRGGPSPGRGTSDRGEWCVECRRGGSTVDPKM